MCLLTKTKRNQKPLHQKGQEYSMILNEEIIGRGTPMIILHGLFGMSTNWKSFGKRLSTRYQIHLMDLRNHGLSGHSTGMNYSDMAGDVIQTFRAHDREGGSILVGHSMGGKTAMQVALEFPNRVKALIVIDIAPVTYEGGHEEILDALLSLPVGQIKSRKEAEMVLLDQVEDIKVVKFLLKNLKRTPQGTYRWLLNIPFIAQNYRKLLSPPSADGKQIYTGPSLFIKGALSSYINERNENSIEKYFPASVVKAVDEAGHWVHADQPDQLANVVLEFLNSHGL